MSEESMPAALRFSEGLGPLHEDDERCAWLTAEIMKNATLEPWEDAMVKRGICPKCSDSLGFLAQAEGLRGSKCMGCANVFIVDAPERV
jgi:hypothetical protein